MLLLGLLLLGLLPVLGRLAGEVVAVVEVVEALAMGVATTGEGLGVGWIFGWTAACTTGFAAGCTALSAAFCTGC